MSFLYEMLTKEEMEEIREHDGYVRGHADGVQEGHASGIKEGLARGTTEGAQAKQRDIAANMLTMGMDIPVIAKATGLSEQDISKLKQTDTLK